MEVVVNRREAKVFVDLRCNEVASPRKGAVNADSVLNDHEGDVNRS